MVTMRVRVVLAVLALAATVLFVGVGPAGAQKARSSTYPTVPTAPPTNPCVAPDGRALCGTLAAGGQTSSSSLPFTGGDVALVAALGLGAVCAGGAILVLSRRKASTTNS
jgi:hypothetical protein